MLPQQRAAALVDLHRHQPRRELHDVRRQAEQPQRARGLQAEQAAADHQPGPPALGVTAAVSAAALMRVQVVERPVDEAAGQVGAGDRRHERVRAGREHQGVVARGFGRRLVVTVRAARSIAGDRLAQVQLEPPAP